MSRELPAPTLKDLVRVVPIGQSQVHGGVTVMMLALEQYADGFVVTFRVLSDEPWPFDIHREGFQHFEVDLRVTTASGTEYDGRMLHSGLSTRMEGWQGRFEYQHAPALDPTASWVRIEVLALHWLKRIPDPPFQAPAKEMTGPWVFTVPLPT